MDRFHRRYYFQERTQLQTTYRVTTTLIHTHPPRWIFDAQLLALFGPGNSLGFSHTHSRKARIGTTDHDPNQLLLQNANPRSGVMEKTRVDIPWIGVTPTRLLIHPEQASCCFFCGHLLSVEISFVRRQPIEPNGDAGSHVQRRKRASTSISFLIMNEHHTPCCL